MIKLINILPNYIELFEVEKSEIFLQNVYFEATKAYLIKAESGKGKSSLLNIIYSINKEYQGKVIYEDNSITNDNIYITKFSYVFQDLKLFNELSLIENLNLKNQLTNHKTESEILNLIEKFGLLNKKDALIKTLSLGQKQRVAILRAMCQPYQVLLLDEPFSHLDKTNIEIASKIIAEDVLKNKASLIMVSLGEDYNFKFDKTYKL